MPHKFNSRISRQLFNYENRNSGLKNKVGTADMFQLALDDSLASLRRKTDTPTDTNDLKRMANNNPMLEFLKEKYAFRKLILGHRIWLYNEIDYNLANGQGASR